jgi:hypothetical protein
MSYITTCKRLLATTPLYLICGFVITTLIAWAHGLSRDDSCLHGSTFYQPYVTSHGEHEWAFDVCESALSTYVMG